LDPKENKLQSGIMCRLEASFLAGQ